MRKALIIIDVQNDFLKGGSLAVEEGNSIISLINSIQNNFDVVVATQDWHPENHKSFARNHVDKKEFEKIELNGLEQVLWPVHCVQGTFGAELHNDLNLNKVSAIIRKGMDSETDSYSAFNDNGKRNSTGLYGFLKEHSVTDVYVCGLAGDYCVYYTAKDAAALDFKTYFIENATKSISKEQFENQKEEMEKIGIHFI